MEAATQAAIELLTEVFPRTFFVYERRRRPLKLGVHLDILRTMDGAITPEELTDALRFYTGNEGYLRACRPEAARIDLNGEPAGAVSAKEAARAAALLEARRSRRAARLVESEPVTKRLDLAALKALGRARKMQEHAP